VGRSGNSRVRVDMASTLDFDLRLNGIAPGSCDLGFDGIVWSFMMDGDDGVFEVLPASGN
jgi:hypothetical protein